MLLDGDKTAFWLRKSVGGRVRVASLVEDFSSESIGILGVVLRGHVRECGGGTNARARAAPAANRTTLQRGCLRGVCVSVLVVGVTCVSVSVVRCVLLTCDLYRVRDRLVPSVVQVK